RRRRVDDTSLVAAGRGRADRMPNTSDVIMDTLERWGVDVVFGLPGDGINGLMEALRERRESIRFVLVRHEEAAAFAATAYAKFTGKLGACIATSGPGGIHLLNGLYDAKLDQAPVLAITGQTFSDLKGSHFQQEINMTLLFQDVALYNQECINPEAIEMLANEACRHALNNRCVAHLTIPVDYQEKEVKGKVSMHKKGHARHTSTRWSPPRLLPREEDLRIAAFILSEAKRPVILAGQGCRGATEELIEVAEKLGAPVVKALLGKEVLPDDHPHCLGGLGLLGTAPSESAMEGCDALLLAGTSFPYMEYL